ARRRGRRGRRPVARPARQAWTCRCPAARKCRRRGHRAPARRPASARRTRPGSRAWRQRAHPSTSGHNRPMDINDLYAEALATFDRLFEEALAAGEPDRTAMVVATVSHTSRPSARTVLLKAHDKHGFVFYTHLDGRKGRELQANNRAALVFHWPRVRSGVQVRVEGMAEQVP